MLDIKRLTSAFAGPFDLQVPKGRCAAIAGPSGSGKSLLLRMIADLDPHDGHVRLDGLDRAGMPAPVWRGQVIYVAAETGWWTDRVRDHFDETDIAAAATDAARLGLDPAILERPVAGLSTGEKQRLALIRALAKNPRVLLLDEPTSGLDPEATARAEALLRERRAAGLVLVLVSHDEAQAGRLGDRRYTMANGQLCQR